MAKGPKKSKAQLEEERLIAEEEARKAKVLEEKRQAEEAERKRVEDLRIKEERHLFRENELTRLSEEAAIARDVNVTRNSQLQAEENAEREKADWEAFINPVESYGTHNEKDLNTFLSTVEEISDVNFEEVFNLVQTIQSVCDGTEERWAENLYNQSMGELGISEENIKRCCDFMFRKLDKVTIQILRFIESHISADRQELLIDAHSKGISFGMWGSFADIRPVRKSVMFDKLGIQIDVPKQILQHEASYTFRVLRVRNDFLSISAYCPSLTRAAAARSSKYIVGDLVVLDVIKPPPRAQTLRAKKWTIRDKSSTSLSVQRVPYPSSVSSKFFIRVPDDVCLSDDVSIAVWDDQELAWSDYGITEYQYTDATRQVQFNCAVVGIFALVKNREADFPYKKWSLSPMRCLSTKESNFEDLVARFSVKTALADIVIDIVGTRAKLMQPNNKHLSDLLGVVMPCGKLLRQLQQRGYNLLPTLSKEEAKKDYDLEMAVLKQIARCAGSFDFEGASEWNASLGDHQSQQIGLHVRESTAFIGGLDVFNYECLLAEVDSQSQSAQHAPAVGRLDPPGVKYSLVMGDEYGSKPKYSLALRPHESSHVEIATSMANRMTAETILRIDEQNVRFEKTIFHFLRLVRPFSCS